jgi:hypothetical protein
MAHETNHESSDRPAGDLDDLDAEPLSGSG